MGRQNSNAEVGIGLICACLPAVTAIYTRRRGGSKYTSGAYGARSGSKGWNAENTVASNQIYVNHSFHLATSPRDDEERRPGDPDQLSQDQIELVTKASWVKV